MQPFGCISFPLVDADTVFKALAHRERRKLLDRLFAENGQSLNRLCAGQKMTRQAVSKHLRILEHANLVATLRRGRDKEHYLNPVPIHAIGARWINKYQRRHLGALHELKNQLEGKGEKSHE